MSNQALYRFWSKTGQLLYIGITMDCPGRFKTHRQKKEWWIEVASITIESFATREQVSEAERQAIKIEHPKYNVQHNGQKKQTVKLPTQERYILWRCDECKQPILDGGGYVHVHLIEADEHRKGMKEFDARHTVSIPGGGEVTSVTVAEMLDEMPDPARWRAHHKKCDPRPDSGDDYWFDIERARTWPKMVEWSAHLSEKNWLVDTDWSSFLYRVLNDNGGVPNA